MTRDHPHDEMYEEMRRLTTLLAPIVALAQQVETAMCIEVALIVPREFGNLIKFYGYDVIMADVNQPYMGVRSRT